jgi:hypothetical protein
MNNRRFISNANHTHLFSKMSLALVCSFTVASCLSAKPLDDELPAPEMTEYWEPIVKTVNVNPVPEDAIVLFDGTDLSQWQHADKRPASWIVNNGVLTVKPGSQNIQTKQAFCNVQLHIEWRSPAVEPNKTGQQLGNSGVFLQNRYEVQILNSFDNATYVNGQAASIYKQSPPLVNASFPPQQWQTYDIIYKAPTFDGDDKLTSPAYMTVMHNGVLVQNHFELKGLTVYRGDPSYSQVHGCDSISLQDHGDKVSFRNIWVRQL